LGAPEIMSVECVFQYFDRVLALGISWYEQIPDKYRIRFHDLA